MEKIIVVPIEELTLFKDELLAQLKANQASSNPTEWLRSKDVRKVLGISESTLQALRVSKSIPSYRLGKTWFYKYDEIVSTLEAGKTRGGFKK